MAVTRSLVLVAIPAVLSAACAAPWAQADAPGRRRVQTTTNRNPPTPATPPQAEKPPAATPGEAAAPGDTTEIEPKPIYLNFINGAADTIERRLAESSPLIPGRVVLFTEPNLGYFPKLWRGRWVHGGTPVEAHLPSHLVQVRKDVERLIPDPNWDGFAVIDYESWGVTWVGGAKPEYQERVLGIARSLHPSAPDEALEAVAADMWNTASTRFLIETIDECKRLRPYAKWGFFGYPKISFGPDPEDERAARVASQQPLLDHSDALYPEAYARRVTIDGNKGTHEFAPEWFFEDHLARLMDWSRRLAGPDKPILPYITLRYNNASERINSRPLTDRDLETMLTVPIREGADGLILWAATGTAGNANRAQTQTRDRVAPLVDRLGLADVGLIPEVHDTPPASDPADHDPPGRRRRSSGG